MERINATHQALAPNDIWTVDFKGWRYSKDRSRCEPLTIRDEFRCFDPGKPSQNGGHERMHRDIKADIQKQIKSDASEIQKAPDLWRHEFNTVRPHEKLGMKCPVDVYQKSKRVYTSEKT